MDLSPSYGETPLDPDELDSLVPSVQELIGVPPLKSTVYDVEQAIQQEVSEHLMSSVVEGLLGVEELIADEFVRDLHARLYGDVWVWAGRTRVREINIGVAPEQVLAELRSSLDTIRYRWENTSDWNARELGMACHAETVRIHPFADGNGRTTRLLADLVFVAAQHGEVLEEYDWAVDRVRYIALLKEFDQHRDPRPLAAFVAVRSFGE